MARGLKYRFGRFGVIAGILITLAAELFLFRAQNIATHDHTGELQRNFSRQEVGLHRFLKEAGAALEQYKADPVALSRRFGSDAPFFLHVYHNDSLVYWNTNKMPVYSIAELHFPVAGPVNLQNGWYYSEILNKGGFRIVGSFLLQRVYPYENEQLKNHFNDLLVDADGVILPEKLPGKSIKSVKGEHVFSFEEVPDEEYQDKNATLRFCGILLLILLSWVQLNRWWKSRFAPLVLAAGFIVLRVLAFQLGWTGSFKTSVLFDPSVLAMSERIPNLGELLITFMLFLVVINAVVRVLRKNAIPALTSKIAVSVYIFLLMLLGAGMSKMGEMMVENSAIPLQLDQIFVLNRFSVIVLLVIGIAGFTYILLTSAVMASYLRAGGKLRGLALTTLAAALLLVIVTLLFTNLVFTTTVWILVLTGTVFFVYRRNEGRWNFSLILLALFLFSIGTTTNIIHFADIKERDERELYANQLADEKDLNTEVEFADAKSRLEKEPYMQRLASDESRPDASELKEALERRVFNGYWERYDMDFFYFGVADSNVRFNGKRHLQLDQLLERHGEVSEVDPDLYFIKDYTSQYTYVFRLPLKIDSTLIYFFGTLKSKKVPEEIGFPRLLISDRAKVFESLENYSIAKYYSGKLVSRHGNYSYPIEQNALPEIRGGKAERISFDKDGYNHLFLRRTPRDYIILSRENLGWLDAVTAVAFLFVLYGLLLAAFLLFESRALFIRFRALSLAVKIQVVLVGLVFVSLLAFGIGSGTFVRNQYESYTSDLIREKLQSVSVVSRIRLGDVDDINKVRSQIDLEYYLRNWSSIFVTDVNIYNLSGQLIGSSRPKIYNIGLLSEQMNPDALLAMIAGKRSEYIHRETLGKLTYLSAYIPYFNNEGKLIAYVNLQHFDQQNEFESQIQRFLVAIINVFMLLLALSIISAIFISSWLTSPLRMIARGLSRMQLGKNNQPIEYTSNDEIGELVKEYNSKLAELERAVVSLAQSERESAWREMAKQVAQEIKNPLTPMKLSIQHLLRIYDPSDPDSRSKIERVANSVIEQIDALTTIANAFSNFAKLPQPNMERMDLVALVRSLIAVYNAEDSCQVGLSGDDEAFILADKDMLLRIMNNLVGNAIQAIPPGRKGRISVSVQKEDAKVVMLVSDNGSGIPKEQLPRIFEPYFTTKSTGTGLGLAMVRQMIEGHSGTISVLSTGTEGTTIEVVFPPAD
jgi:two-component system, NtrC family, nitrogen regulation sensor histidine kinase NtrY